METQPGDWSDERTCYSLIELLAEAETALEQVPGVVADGPLVPAQTSTLRRAHAGVRQLREQLASCAAELRRRDQALHASERAFHLVADFTADWEFWRAPEGHFLYVSPSCERITGYRAQEFLSDADLYRRIVHAGDRHLVEKHLREPLTGKVEPGLEFRIVTRDGQTRWIEHVCRPVYGDDGTWLGRRGSNRDVTLRKHDQQERERLLAEVDGQRRFIQAVADFLPVGVVVLDARELRVRWANPTYLLFLDEPFRSQGVIGAHLEEFIPRAEETGIMALFHEVAATGRAYVDPELEYTGFARGTTYWNWSLQRLPPLPGEEGDHLLLLAYEVTGQVLARREAERAAAEARQRAAELNAVMEAIPHGVTIYGPQAEILQSNQAGQDIAQQSEAYLRAPLHERMKERQFIWPDGRLMAADETPAVRALKGETVRNVVMGMHVGGPPIWLSISGAALRGPGGDIEGAVLSFTDVTDLRQTQSDLELLARKLEIQAEQLLNQNVELIRARDELELRVQERTAELVTSNDALHAEIAVRRRVEAEQKEAQEALARAERLHTVGLLVSSLSHELNNPLQAAIGCLGLAREAVQEGRPLNPYLEVSHDALQRAVGVMVQMRGLYNAPAGERTQAVDLDALSRKVLLMTQQRCATKGVRVLWEPGPDLPGVVTAPNVLQQVFLNVVLNAVDAMPGGGELRVAAEHCPEQGKVWVRFADTGGGITPERLKHLFEPFHSTKADGLGLGLFISRNLMQRLGGGIEVESTLGRGTTVSVWLPV